MVQIHLARIPSGVDVSVTPQHEHSTRLGTLASPPKPEEESPKELGVSCCGGSSSTAFAFSLERQHLPPHSRDQKSSSPTRDVDVVPKAADDVIRVSSFSDISVHTTDRESPVKDIQSMSSRAKILGFTSFLFCGMASLICWQFLIATLHCMERHMLMGRPHGNSVLGVYQIGCIFMQLLFMTCVDAMKPSLIASAIVVDGILSSLVPLVLTNFSYTTRLALLHVIALGFGVCAGVVSGGSIAIASAMPYNLIGAFSMGQGACGIFAFLVNLIFSTHVFDLSTYSGTSNMLWVTFGVGSGMSMISAILLVLAVNQSWAKENLQKFWVAKRERAAAAAAAAAIGSDESAGGLSFRRKFMGTNCRNRKTETSWQWFLRRWRGTHAAAAEVDAVRAANEGGIGTDSTESSVVDETILPSRGWHAMLRASWVYLLATFLNLAVTLNVYPRLGPLKWNYYGFSDRGEQYIILFGIFCLGDFIGKGFPVVSRSCRWLRFLALPKRIVLPLVIVRIIFIGLFLMGHLVRDNSFVNSFGWYVVLMLSLAITGGWCVTSSIIYACESVRRFEEKEIIGPATILVLLLGIFCGVYSAYVY